MIATPMSSMPMVSTKRKREEDHDHEDRIYSCKTCNKEFFSFQALGGHRAGHNNRIKNEDDVAFGTVSNKFHTCLYCFEKFVSGQALGGHMRKHREAMEEKANTDRSPKRKILSEYPKEDTKSLRMVDTDLVKKRETFVGEGSKRKIISENYKDKALRLLDPDLVLKSGMTFGKKFVGEGPRCDCNSRLVTRDFFPMEPLWVKKAPVVIEPVLEEHRAWLELKLGLPCGD